ncbi:MAG: hypothetical protein WB586_07290 [Chthoniobacterales bacterium]
MPEEELQKWRDSIKARSEALDREVAKRLKEVSDVKAEEERLAKTDRAEWVWQLVLKHKFQVTIGVQSDFEAECGKAASRNDVAFFQSVAKAIEQILEDDERNRRPILKTILEVFHELCAERHRRFLDETQAEVDQKLTQLARSNPAAYKQLLAFARHSPQINVQAVLNRTAPVPAALKEQLAFLNRPRGHIEYYGWPTKKEVREETIRRMRQRYGRDWTPPEPNIGESFLQQQSWPGCRKPKQADLVVEITRKNF